MTKVLRFKDIKQEILGFEGESISLKQLEQLLESGKLVKLSEMGEVSGVSIFVPEKRFIPEFDKDRQRFIAYYMDIEGKLVSLVDGCIVVGEEVRVNEFRLLDDMKVIEVGLHLAVGYLDCLPPVIREAFELEKEVKQDSVLN